MPSMTKTSMKGLQQMFGITFDRNNNSYGFNQTRTNKHFLMNSIRQANRQTCFVDLIRQISPVIMMMIIMTVTLGNLKHRQTHKGGDWTGHKALNLRPLMMTRFLLSQINLRPLMMTHAFKFLNNKSGGQAKISLNFEHCQPLAA